MSEIRVKELRIGKGVTKQNGEEWHKRYYEVTVDTSGCHDAICIEETRIYAEDLLAKWLNQPEPTTKTSAQPRIPDFNPEILMKHPWKGNRKPKGGHYSGSLEWGWAHASEFPTAILDCLPQIIGEYEFTLSDNKKVVNVQKAKP